MRARLAGAALAAVFVATPSPATAQAAAQAARPALAPDVAIRPFFLVSEQRFAATKTFDAIFGQIVRAFWGGGAQVALANGLYADVALSRFSASGSRVFHSEGESFSLGVPLDITITPIEITGGYRFGAARSGAFVPYVGAGLTSYRYRESGDFDLAASGVDVRGHGYLAVGGAELRVNPWTAVSVDVQLTRVGGVLGSGGISQEVGEDDLGGAAVRFRFIIGR